MDEHELSPAQVAARDELHDLLQRHAKLLGPWDEDGELGPIPDTVFVDHWVLVAAWTDEHGNGYLTRIPSAGIRNYQRTGLLHEGLHGFAD